MTQVNRVDTKGKMSRWDVVKFQLMFHFFVKSIRISESELDCLTLLCIEGEQELTKFCTLVHEKNIFKTPQSVRNVLRKAEKRSLVVKVGKNRKKIGIHPSINVQTQGNILLGYNLLCFETTES